MQARYFGVARRLLASRADAPEEIAHHPIMLHPVSKPWSN
jgi:hypothetical protein